MPKIFMHKNLDGQTVGMTSNFNLKAMQKQVAKKSAVQNHHQNHQFSDQQSNKNLL